jgi:hypothetical protein
MSSILCDALCFHEGLRFEVESFSVPPPAALLATAPIFSALAPRTSRFCEVTPPLLALLRRSPFFCFTQHFRLLHETEKDVCDIIRECVAIKSLHVSCELTALFVDAILSSSGSYVTRTLVELDGIMLKMNWSPILPLILPSTSPMTPAFLRTMASMVLWHFFTHFLRLSRDASSQLLHSSLDALEGRREQLWEPALLVMMFLVRELRSASGPRAPVIDESAVRRCIAIVETLIDADEHVALLAVHLLTCLLEKRADLVVPLLLRESDALRGVLMFCDHYLARIQRGHRVAALCSHDLERAPLHVMNVALRKVLEVVPSCNIVEVLCYRDGERIRTVLDIITAYRTSPRVAVIDGGPPEVHVECRYRAFLVADPHGREVCEGLDRNVLQFFASVWPKPFNIAGHPARQQLLEMIAERVQSAFDTCDKFSLFNPAVIVTECDADENAIACAEVKIKHAADCVENALRSIEPALSLVDKANETWYELVNAHVLAEQRALDRVRLFNSVMSIRRRDGGSDNGAEVQPVSEAFADILAAFLHMCARLERSAVIGSWRASRALEVLIDNCTSSAWCATCFLLEALRDCLMLLGASVLGGNEETTAAAPSRRRERPDDDGEQSDEVEVDASAAVHQCLESIRAVLRSPETAVALKFATRGSTYENLADAALKLGSLSSDQLDAICTNVVVKYKRSHDEA